METLMGGDQRVFHVVVDVNSEDLEIGLLGFIGGGEWSSGECIS